MTAFPVSEKNFEQAMAQNSLLVGHKIYSFPGDYIMGIRVYCDPSKTFEGGLIEEMRGPEAVQARERQHKAFAKRRRKEKYRQYREARRQSNA